MLNITNYHRAQSIKEAYELNLKKSNVVLGGMLWLKMQRKSVNTAIDLCDLNMDKIEETESEYHIGSMTSLRAIEIDAALNAMTNGAFNECLKQLVGVQFRNLATVGGSVFSKFGFSDITTLLLSMGAKLEFYKRGVTTLEDFLKSDYERDILIKIIIDKKQYNTVFISQKNSKTDFAVLNCAVTEHENSYSIAVGARPHRAELIHMSKQENIEVLAEKVSKQFVFGSNTLASRGYREHICKVLITRAVKKLKERK